jgi:hypothetical protein
MALVTAKDEEKNSSYSLKTAHDKFKPAKIIIIRELALF